MGERWSERGWVSMTAEHVGDDGVVRVTMTGPGKNNAMGPDFWAEVPQLFRALDRDPAVRAVVLAGAGRNFTYGLDLAGMGEVLGPVMAGDGGLAAPRTAFLDHVRDMQQAGNAIADCRKPVVAAVQGRCLGGGIDVISACDVRYASADATFSIREVKVAIVADMGTLQRLPAIIGDGHLRELALTGRDVDAARAEKIGLVNDVLPDAEAVLAHAHAVATEIARNPPLVVHGIKDVLDADRAGRVQAGLRYVAAWNAAFLASEDLTEAMTAVFAQREARFTGR